ncbi:MAG TPA: ABC transporter permease [Thermoanaerobaculia bacterium]|nr:ABC transporter permease [Thermoanaerobaculia bacterium]
MPFALHPTLAIFEDVLFILRRFRHSALFLLVTLTTLAVSMGASTTMFTVVNAFLLSSLPYEDADRLVMIWTRTSEASKEIDSNLPLSPGAFSDLRENSRSFEQIASFLTEGVNVSEPDGTTRAQALFVSGDFFPLLRSTAAIGRTLGREDERENAPRVVVISHGYWQRHFGGDPRVVGRTIEFGGQVYGVVGVLPDEFHFSESLVAADPSLSRPVEIWVPYNLGANAHERGFHYLNTVGRLRSGITLAAARQEMHAYAKSAAEQYPDTDKRYGLKVVSLRNQIFGHLRPVLLTLWAATGFLLLIACANMATLLIARAQTGRRNTAVRLALGASRQRIVGESLAESVGLSLVGGLLSLGVAFVMTRLLTGLNPVNVFQSYPPKIDLQVAAFTIGVSLVAGLLFGGAPAFWASRIDVANGLGEGGTRLTSRSRRVFSVLVISQIALATTLLIGMGLSLKSFHGLLRADLGVDIKNILTLDLVLPRSQYRNESRKAAFFRALLDRTKALPGVESVGMNYALPFNGVDPSNGLEIEGRTFEKHREPSANLGFVNPDYFNTLGIPLLRGRFFLPSDTSDAPLVAIIDKRLVEQQFGSQDPLGRRISIASNDKLTIVGVVGAVKQDAFEKVARPYVYLPYQQRSYMFTSFAIKTSVERPQSLAPSVRALVSKLDKEVPVANVSTLGDAYRNAIAPQRFSLLLISVFAEVSLFLMQVGTYGAMAYLARQRRGEAGIRMALGAEPMQIFELVFKQGLALSLTGTAIGLGLAIAAGKVMANLVTGIETFDWTVFSIVSATALLAAFVAYYSPARALSRVDPSSSLQSL